MAADKHHFSGNGPIQDGFKYNSAFVHNPYQALCYIIPTVAFGFLGIETVAVTAFEAKSSRSLRFPSQYVAYLTLVLYFLCMIGQILNVPWNDENLPLIYEGIGNSTKDTKDLIDPKSSNLTIIALWDWHKRTLAGFLNGAMIFSVLSASNTSLYIASRTLYGLALDVPPGTWLGRQVHKLSTVVPQTGVPAAALIFSAVSFIWLPFINLKKGYAVQYLLEIIQISSSVSGMIVWAALSFAYLRYYIWLKKCDDNLTGDYERFKRGTRTYKPFTVFAWAQPFPAIAAVTGCLVVFAFCSATWWTSPITISKVAIGYAAPIILLTIFIMFKLVKRRLWVRTSSNFTPLAQTLELLSRFYKTDEKRTNLTEAENAVLSPPRASPNSDRQSDSQSEQVQFRQERI
ncbi:hypothetical protein K504DRAFT_484560 [Pleomassaria siparia CBS 279.74]|uniref:Amino acid permease/ SLC12A domain-containing protein n=1 Tax=Pleomassaria siparia CBS 279.74 TaxID=1314801 RepID=A0A6G1JXZ1_9PLEO|nr:hypothetical protein K504DRAFT_484560 [Pleomassaria siparia CBS 279.74]